MTIEEVKDRFGEHSVFGLEEGYILCNKCPLENTCEASDPDGFEKCWQYIAERIGEDSTENGEKLHDAVEHPSHYTQGGIECIDAMEAAFGAQELAVYCKIAAFKYIWRCKYKNGLEDVKKAVWYLNKYIELEGGAE